MDTGSPVNLLLPLPWHAPVLAKLEQAWRSQRLPHALLIHGIEGLGKRAFAGWLTQALQCETADDRLRPCNTCAACRLVMAGSHPDTIFVQPEEDKQQISVEQVRAANERLGMTSSRRGYRIAVIHPAHQLTVSAANSLLKTLEEPGSRSLLILLTSKFTAVLATLRSRCQHLAMSRPSPDIAAAWLRERAGSEIKPELLNFAGGAPLRALAYADGRFEELQRAMNSGVQDLLAGRADVTQIARAWNGDDLPERLLWLDGWICGRLRRKILGNDDQVTQIPIAADTAGLPSQPLPLNISGAYSLLDRLRELRAQLARTALQRELALENFLIGLLQVMDPRASA